MQDLLPIAHLGADHWGLYVLYLAPPAIVVGAIVASTFRQRRADASREPDNDFSAPGPDPS
ncbi:hypothetical protein HJD18_15675 [Thermoleophilia bacterium SCSIO 60948]|nr:hypothetical protein HJD18_15675 [Thermoleophilia bacterium SCSIO 60948]